MLVDPQFSRFQIRENIMEDIVFYVGMVLQFAATTVMSYWLWTM